MVRRGRSPPVATSPSGQRRLDELDQEGTEARAERDYQDLRRSRSAAAPLPYEDRVAAWIRLRDETVRRRASGPQGSAGGNPTTSS